ENAALKLVAGDVNRVAPTSGQVLIDEEDQDGSADDRGFKQENLFEYHLYSLGLPTTILDKETKQVSLLAAEGIAVKKKLVFSGEQYFYRGLHGQLASNQKVGVFVEFQNSQQNKLGLPLPK